MQFGPALTHQGNDERASDAKGYASDISAIHPGILQQVLQQAGLAREAAADDDSGEHGGDAPNVRFDVCARVEEIGVSRLSEAGLIADADDDDQKGIEEDVCAGDPGEPSGEVEGKDCDQDEDGTAEAKVEGRMLQALDSEQHGGKQRGAVEGDTFWEGDAHEFSLSLAGSRATADSNWPTGLDLSGVANVWRDGCNIPESIEWRDRSGHPFHGDDFLD